MERRLDIEANLKRYLGLNDEGSRFSPKARYASFDYCFNYFQSFRESNNSLGMISDENIQTSCLQLGFF